MESPAEFHTALMYWNILSAAKLKFSSLKNWAIKKFLNNSPGHNNFFLLFQPRNENIWKISTKTIQNEAGNQHNILVQTTEV